MGRKNGVTAHQCCPYLDALITVFIFFLLACLLFQALAVSDTGSVFLFRLLSKHPLLVFLCTFLPFIRFSSFAIRNYCVLSYSLKFSLSSCCGAAALRLSNGHSLSLCTCPSLVFPLGKMKSRSKKGWKTLVPLHLKGKSAVRFSLFPKVNSNSYGPGETPVYLNVYDLTPINGYMYWTGLGIYHSGVEVYGVEYAFGAHDYPTSGVFEVEPRQCPGFKFRKSIFIGTTCLDPVQVREFMERQSTNYNGDTYHLIVKNCNHFCKDICYKLTGKSIPTWVNRLARLGSVCNCILPEALRISAVRHDPDFQTRESEKRKLRSAVNCLSSISLRQKHLSTSSLFLQSPLKGCLSSWEFRKSIKER